jgi:predicted ATPase
MSPTSPPPIAIASLQIRDFRVIDSLDLDFRGPDGLPNNLVVLAGPNGSGKTTVLEAAVIAVSGHKLAVGSRGPRAVRSGAKDYEIRAEIRSRTNIYDENEVVLISSRSALPETSTDLPYWYFSSWRAPIFVGALNVTLGKSGRHLAKTDPNRLRMVKQQLANAAVQSIPGARQPLLGSYSKWIARINEAWKSFYPDHDDEFAVGLTESEEQGDGAFEVFYKRAGSPPHSVNDLSAGQLELFLLLASLVFNDNREGIVFIDEPELHLDPQWHASIVPALMRLQPQAQFIVATHSTEIYDAAMSYERHFLVAEDDPRVRAWPSVGVGA